MIAAQQYYIEYGTDLNVERIYTLLPSYIPDYCLTNAEKSVDRWGQLIIMAYKKSYYLKEKVAPSRVKEDVVSYAKFKWPLLFSRFYEAYRNSGTHSHCVLIFNQYMYLFMKRSEFAEERCHHCCQLDRRLRRRRPRTSSA